MKKANLVASTVKTNPTRTSQTSVFMDTDTIVSKIDTVFEKFMQDARKQRIEDWK